MLCQGHLANKYKYSISSFYSQQIDTLFCILLNLLDPAPSKVTLISQKEIQIQIQARTVVSSLLSSRLNIPSKIDQEAVSLLVFINKYMNVCVYQESSYSVRILLNS